MANEDMWAELDAVYKLPNRQPGDIDSSQLMERYGKSSTSALRLMHKWVNAGGWKFFIVKDPTCNHGQRLIIRKVNPNAEYSHNLEP